MLEPATSGRLLFLHMFVLRKTFQVAAIHDAKVVYRTNGESKVSKITHNKVLMSGINEEINVSKKPLSDSEYLRCILLLTCIHRPRSFFTSTSR